VFDLFSRNLSKNKVESLIYMSKSANPNTSNNFLMVELCLSLDSSKRLFWRGDALKAVNALRKEGLYWLAMEWWSMIPAKALLSSFREWKVSHTKRVGNAEANELAKLGLRVIQIMDGGRAIRPVSMMLCWLIFACCHL
jgi:hypothetical protein